MQEQDTRAISVELSEDIAETLLDNQETVKQLNQTIQTIHALDQKTIARICAKAGRNLGDFQAWEYERRDGKYFLKLVPPPMPMPEQPVPVAPKGD